MATKTTACQWQLLHAHTKLNYILLKRDIIMAFVSPHPSPSPIPSQNTRGNINTSQTSGERDEEIKKKRASERCPEKAWDGERGVEEEIQLEWGLDARSHPEILAHLRQLYSTCKPNVQPFCHRRPTDAEMHQVWSSRPSATPPPCKHILIYVK